MKSYLIAASILENDILRIADEVDQVLMAGVDVIHIESNCIDSLSIGCKISRALRDHGVKCPIDIHLTGETSSELIESYAKAGATSVTICPETVVNIDQSLIQIKDADCNAGLALPYPFVLSGYSRYLDSIDQLLFLLGDKELMPDVLIDIANVDSIRNETNNRFRVQAKGGITASNVGALVRAGVDTFILDKTAFSEHDYYTGVSMLRKSIVQGLA